MIYNNKFLLIIVTTLLIISININFGLSLEDNLLQQQEQQQTVPVIQIIRFKNTSICTLSKPCDWFNKSIWEGDQVPHSSNTTAYLTMNKPPTSASPTFYIFANQSIELYSLTIGYGFQLNVGPGRKNDTFQLAGSISVYQGIFVLEMASNIYQSITSIGGEVLIKNNRVNLNGDLYMDSLSTLIATNSDFYIYGPTSTLYNSVSLSNSNLWFNGDRVNVFGGIIGDKYSIVQVFNAYFSSAGSTFGSLIVSKSVVFMWSPITLAQIQTYSGASVSLSSTSLYVIGTTSSYISQLNFLTYATATFVNSSSITIDNVYGQLYYYGNLKFHNCYQAVVGSPVNTPYSNTIGTIALSGTTTLSFGAITNITYGISPLSYYSTPSQPDNINIYIANQTQILAYSYLNNCTITVNSQSQLNLTAGFQIKQLGGMFVESHASLNLSTPLFSNVLYSYSFGDQGLVLGDISNLYTRFANISGNILMNGVLPTFTSNYTFVHGDVIMNGNGFLNINVGVPSVTGVNFKARTIQQSNFTTININLLPTKDLQHVTVGVKLTNANLNGIVNILTNMSQSSYYMGQSINVLQSKNEIQGNPGVSLTDISTTKPQSLTMNYDLQNNGSMITISFGSRSLAPWKIVAIVFGCVIGFSFFVTLIVIAVKKGQKKNCHDYNRI